MGVYVNVFEEIRLRLAAAKTAGTIFYNDIFVGNINEYRKDWDYPIIVIGLNSGYVNPDAARYQTTDILDIEIRVAEPKLLESNINFYKTADKTGPLFQFEKILNAIEKNRTTSAIDISFAGAAHIPFSYSFEIDDRHDSVIVSIIKLRVHTAKFTRGDR